MSLNSIEKSKKRKKARSLIEVVVRVGVIGVIGVEVVARVVKEVVVVLVGVIGVVVVVGVGGVGIVVEVVEVVGVIKNTRKKQKTFSSVKVKLIDLPEEYIAEFEAVEKRLRSQGLPTEEIERRLYLCKLDLKQAYRRCQRENFLNNIVSQIVRLLT